MTNVIIDVAGSVLQVVLVGLVGLAFAWFRKWVTSKRLAEALDMLENAATVTVAELQQTTVNTLKAASADGKLAASDIARLSRDALKLAANRLNEPAQEALRAAGLDIEDMIKAHIEKAVLGLKQSEAEQATVTIDAFGLNQE